MKTEFTPSPWTVTGGYSPQVKAGAVVIATPGATPDAIGGTNLSEHAANARLIAAAPELLAACEEALEALPPPGVSVSPLFLLLDETLRKAIARARGE